MKRNALNVLVCPVCKSSLLLTADEHEGPEVITGRLHCARCDSAYPIVRGVPRFVATGSYATSFGRQWNWFRTVQLDSRNGKVAAAVKTGGSLAVYLYDRHGPDHVFTDFWRRITTRLPHALMAVVTLLAIPLYFIYRLPILGKILHLVLPISMEADWRWRWLDTFDWYTPKYQWKFLYPEVFRWFRENSFRDVEIFDGPIRMSGVKTCHPEVLAAARRA